MVKASSAVFFGVDCSFFSDAFQELALGSITSVGSEALVLLHVLLLVLDYVELVLLAWVGPVLMLIAIIAATSLHEVTGIEVSCLEVLKFILSFACLDCFRPTLL